MTDFVIAVATAAMLAAPAPAPSAASAATSSIPLNAPTVGFRVCSDAASCEQAAAALTARPGARLVCVPVEPMSGELASPTDARTAPVRLIPGQAQRGGRG